MPLVARGTKAGFDEQRVLHALVDLAIAATDKAQDLGALEEKLIRQQRWLDAHDPVEDGYSLKVGRYWELLIRRKRWREEIADFGREADALVAKLSAAGKVEAEAIVEGLSLGSAHVWAIVEAFAPYRALFAHDEREARDMLLDRIAARLGAPQTPQEDAS